MSDVDVSKLSDQQLMALIQGGQPVQPVDAKTGQPLNRDQSLAVASLAAAGGIDPRAEGGSARLPLAQHSAQDTPPAGAYYFDPQGHVRQQPQASAVQPALKGVSDSLNAAATGVPIVGGFLKEADAATDAAIAPYVEPLVRKAPKLVQALMGYDPSADIGNLPTFQARYDAARNLQRFSADQFRDQHPNLDTGLKIGGGVAGALAALPVLGAGTAALGPEAGLLARSAAGATEGAVIGGADAYGRGTGALDDPSRIHGAEAGAMFGGIGGGALPVAAQVGRVAYRGTVGKLVDALRGERIVQAPAEADAAQAASRLRGFAGSPDQKLDIEAALIAAKRDPLTVNASSLDDAYVRIARAIQRQDMTPEQAVTASQDVGPLGVLADTGESARDLLRAAMNRPGPGATIAEENLRPRQAGVFDPDTGTWLARPSSTRITDQAKAGLGLDGKDFHTEDEALLATRKAAADPAYEAMRAHPPVALANLAEFSGSPVFKNAYDDARKIAAKAFVTLPDGTEKIVPLPAKMPAQLDWRTLDLMKQAMDDTISTAPQQGIGASSRGASKDYLRRYVGKLDSLNPDYAPAREAFSGPTAMKEALQEGRGLLNEDAPTVAADIASRPEGERQMLRLGAYQALQTKLGNANVTFDAANQAGLLKPNQLARFKALFPDAKSFADFYKAMQAEKTMYATNAAAFGNSSTAKQLLNVNEPSDPLLEGVSRVAESVPTGNVMGLIRGIHQLGQESPMSEGAAATIVSVLSRHLGPDGKVVIKRLTEAQRRAALLDAMRKANGSAAGTTAGETVQRDQ